MEAPAEPQADAAGPDDGTNRPIGVFDSGVGGVSVLGAIRSELPAEDIVYVADSAHAPYGDRSPEYIEARALSVAAFLVSQRAKALVVACNTATGAAVDSLRARYSIPIVAMEPAVKPAATRTRSGVIGVLATARTLSSAKFLRLVDAHATGVQVLVQPCPGLVEQVEKGALRDEITRAMVERYVRPLLDRGADTLVLGCTHYPFLRPLIQDVAGEAVALVDPAVAVARELRRRLAAAALLRDTARHGAEIFWSSGPADEVSAVLRQLWRGTPSVNQLPAGAHTGAPWHPPAP